MPFTSGGTNFDSRTGPESPLLHRVVGLTVFLDASGTFKDTKDAANERFPVAVREGLKAASVAHGQATITTEAALPTASARRFRVKALGTNTAAVYIGTTGVTAANGYPLEPGDEIVVEVSNLNVIKAIAGSGSQKIAYFGEV